MKNNYNAFDKLLIAKGMLRYELLAYFGSKEMVVFASLNKATYQIVDPNRDLFKLEKKEDP